MAASGGWRAKAESDSTDGFPHSYHRQLVLELFDSTCTFAMSRHGFETNKHASCRALFKWLKHLSKHSNEMVDKLRLAWQAISDR